MQIDMHFYDVYGLARAAGITPSMAGTIAWASQFVDDAVEDEATVLEGPEHRAVLPTMTSHKPIDYQNTIPGDQWKVWVPFHFLPGNDETADTFVGKMACRKYSVPVRTMLAHALQYKAEPFGPYLAGIAAHGDRARPIPWDSIVPVVYGILKEEGKRADRVRLWKDAISSGSLFDPADEDVAVSYSETLWKSESVIRDFSAGEQKDCSDACLFFTAAWKHRTFVLRKLLPAVGLIA